MFQVKSSSAKVAKTGAARFKSIRSKVFHKRIIYVVPQGKGSAFKFVKQTVPGTQEWVLELPM